MTLDEVAMYRERAAKFGDRLAKLNAKIHRLALAGDVTAIQRVLAERDATAEVYQACTQAAQGARL